MNQVKCSRGHYYDGDKYEQCPHCKEACKDNNDEIFTAPISYIPISNKPTEPTEPVTISGEEMSAIIDKEKTIGVYSANSEVEPVVGWVVVIDGPEKGMSYSLKAGKNFIGRTYGLNDIVLQNDMSVSREKHAIVVYDPKSGAFLVQPGMSSELFYLNDEVVLQAKQINTRDIITIGGTKLMFIPFCEKGYTWDAF